jgi:DNA-directed RNA polymerase specialized sigma subunit
MLYSTLSIGSLFFENFRGKEENPMDKRYIWLDGEEIYVSEEIYREYYRPIWRESKQKDIRKNKEYSLDVMSENGFEIADKALVDEIVAEKMLLDELYAALDELTADERELINALFFEDRTEDNYAYEKGISQQAVHKKKVRILANLKKLLKK